MTLTLHMVTSLDGYAATRGGDVSWMDASWDRYENGAEMNADILKTIDRYVMGSRTYELTQELGWPYGQTPTTVVTSRQLRSDRANVEFYSGDLHDLAKQTAQENAWLVGGPTLCGEFLRLNLVDKVCLTIVPILLGDGVALFAGDAHRLHLNDVTAYKNGMIDVWYDVAPAQKS